MAISPSTIQASPISTIRPRSRKWSSMENCRLQQVHDGCFPDLNAVPQRALSLTIPALMSGGRLFCVVPGPTKAQAVREMLKRPDFRTVPREHTQATPRLHSLSGCRVGRRSSMNLTSESSQRFKNEADLEDFMSTPSERVIRLMKKTGWRHCHFGHRWQGRHDLGHDGDAGYKGRRVWTKRYMASRAFPTRRAAQNWTPWAWRR